MLHFSPGALNASAEAAKIVRVRKYLILDACGSLVHVILWDSQLYKSSFGNALLLLACWWGHTGAMATKPSRYSRDDGRNGKVAYSRG